MYFLKRKQPSDCIAFTKSVIRQATHKQKLSRAHTIYAVCNWAFGIVNLIAYTKHILVYSVESNLALDCFLRASIRINDFRFIKTATRERETLKEKLQHNSFFFYFVWFFVVVFSLHLWMDQEKWNEKNRAFDIANKINQQATKWLNSTTEPGRLKVFVSESSMHVHESTGSTITVRIIIWSWIFVNVHCLP